MLFLLLLFLVFTSCGPQRPDYVDGDGREYSINSRCIKSHTESDYGYHYGYNFMSGKYEWHWGRETKTICDEWVLDTTEINTKEKYYKKK